MNTISRLFGGDTQVKIMRLFLLNQGRPFGLAEIIQRTDAKKREIEALIGVYLQVGLIQKKDFFPVVTEGKVGKAKKAQRVKGWMLNEFFPLRTSLQELVVGKTIVNEKELVARLSKAGKLKLVVVAGVFIQNWDSRADILIVGEKLNDSRLRKVIAKLESEVGRDIRYAALSSQDFHYRVNICDRLVRDMFDYPHKVILDKLGIRLSF